MHQNTSLSPLNILMIAPQYRPLVGGYERAAERLSAALVKRGLKVTVVTERRDPTWPSSEYKDGVIISRLWCIYRPRVHIATALISFALFLLLRGRRYDVWHVHQYGQHATLAIALGKLLRRPVVLKLTSSGDQGLTKTTENGRFAAITKLLLKRVAAVVTLTRETTREAQVFGIAPERIHQLGNGVDTNVYRPIATTERAYLKQSLGLDDRRIAIYVGRLSPEKNPDGLLTAWQNALPALPNGWVLIIVGNGPMHADLQKRVQQDNSKTVLMVGLQHNVDQWLAAADIYISPSHHEGLSNTMLEAMATELAVIATQVSGVSELIEEPGAGLVVPVADMKALAHALTRFASDENLRKQMGATAKSIIDARYSLEAVAAAYEALYLEMKHD